MQSPDDNGGRRRPESVASDRSDDRPEDMGHVVTCEAQGVGLLRRALYEALVNNYASTWLRRATEFERAKPVEPPGGFRDPEIAREQWRRCHVRAQACRNAATLAPVQDIRAEVDAVLEELLG